MKIITCYKCVPDEQDIAVNNADGSLDFSKADAKISQYDLNAIEAACQLKQQAAEAQVTALSVGGKALTNAKGRKDVLSRGPDELIVVIDDQFEQALPQQTASALAAAAQKAGFDLILCGMVLPTFMPSRLVCWWAKSSIFRQLTASAKLSP